MINNSNYWATLYTKYTNQYGDDHTKLISALISENIKDWQNTKLQDINTTYSLILRLENATDHAYALMLRTIYEIMEHSDLNLYKFGTRCGEISSKAILEVINGSDELNTLLKINNSDDNQLITAICSECTISNAYETLAYVMNNKNNNLHRYKQDPTYKIFFSMLFVRWNALHALINPDMKSQDFTTPFKHIGTLCRDHVKNWLDELDLICETEEDKWSFLIGWHTLSLSPLLQYIEKTDRILIQKVTNLVNEQIKSKFNVDINQLDVLETLYDFSNIQLHKQKVEFFKTLKIESCELPEIS